MRATRTTTCMLVFASLLLAGAITWAGCGGDDSSAQGSFPSASEAFVASTDLGKPGQMGISDLVDGVTQVRNATVSYEVKATDPRVSGTFDVVYSYDQTADGSGAMWGTWTVTNDKGTWVCDAWRGA
jgi:hypothetical protein